MKKVILAAVVAVNLVGVSCGRVNQSVSSLPAIPVHGQKKLTVDQYYRMGFAVPSEILVMTQASPENLEKLRKSYSIETLDVQLGAYLVRSPEGQEEKVSGELKETGLFEVIEPNFVRQVSAQPAEATIPKDKKWFELWGLKNYGQDAPNGMDGIAGADIGALQAWTISKGSRDIVVAIVDTGIDYTHPDLKSNIWQNTAEVNGVPGQDDDGNGYVDDLYGWDFVSGTRDKLHYGQKGDPDPMDGNGHGTHVAGTIGAVGDNGIGVVGINWQVRLMAVKFLSDAGSGSSADEIRSVRYAIDQGADVINASYGGGPRSVIMEKLIEAGGKKGLLFVAAAGNDGTSNDLEPHFPSNYSLPNLISVAATDNRDQLASFSNYGDQTVHLAAPGVGITSTFPLALSASGADPLPYRNYSGTSMATPHVVGAAALVLAARPELRKNPAALKERLLQSVDWLPQLAGRVISGGRLNVAKAIRGETSSVPIGELAWTKEAYSAKSPSRSQERQEWVLKIQKPGVKAIRARIARGQIDTGYDVATIYDSQYRFMGELPSQMENYWTPSVQGDTMYIKFSNAIVAIQKYKEFFNLDTMTPSPDGSIIAFCEAMPSGKFNCYGWDRPSAIFANFDSDGFEIDQISYVQ